MAKVDKRTLKTSFWAALGRLLGVFMGAGAGSFLYQILGAERALALTIAIIIAVSSFFLTWFAEYEREKSRK